MILKTKNLGNPRVFIMCSYLLRNVCKQLKSYFYDDDDGNTKILLIFFIYFFYFT